MATQPHTFKNPYFWVNCTPDNYAKFPDIACKYVQQAPEGADVTAKNTWPDGTEYDASTPHNIVEILQNYKYSARNPDAERLILEYGDSATGRAWEDQRVANTNGGYIGRSTGSHKIPLLIRNRRSMGGEAILTGNIVRIRFASGKAVLYQHPNFHYQTPATDEQPV